MEKETRGKAGINPKRSMSIDRCKRPAWSGKQIPRFARDDKQKTAPRTTRCNREYGGVCILPRWGREAVGTWDETEKQER